MCVNLNTPSSRSKLFQAIQFHYGQLSRYRDARTDIIRQCAGERFSLTNRRLILGLLRQALDAHVMGLAANLPCVLFTTKQPEYMAFAKQYSAAMNLHIKEIRLDRTLMEIAHDSFFGPGIAKVYIGDSLMEVKEGDLWVDPGKTFVERKSLDDFVYDTLAGEYRKSTFMCDRYRLPLELVLEDKMRFPKDVREMLLPSSRIDSSDARSIGGTGDEEDKQGKFMDMIDLIDVFIPSEQRVYTFLVNGDFKVEMTKPLQVTPWYGDEVGPYKLLNLGYTPDNVMPAAPAYYLANLDKVINVMLRKLARQAERSKTLGLSNAEPDLIDKIKRASDGDVLSGEPDALVEASFGAVNNNLFGFAQDMIGKFDRGAGNLTLRAGLGAATDTATQDQMLAGQVNRIEASLQLRFKDFVVDILRDVARFLFDDPVTEYPQIKMEISGSQIEVDAPWKPGDREGTFDDYDLTIEPYDPGYKNPMQRAEDMRQFVMEMSQMLPMMMQSGVDVAAYIEEQAELRNMPRLKKIFAQLLPPPADQQTQEPGSTMSPHTSRTYTRRSESAGPDPNASQIQQMMSDEGNIMQAGAA